MRKTIICIFLSLVIFTSKGQTNFGIEAGALLSSAKIKSSGEEIGKSKKIVGFKAGMFLEMPLSSKVFFNPGLYFVSKGGRYTDIGVDEKIQTQYIEAPLNIEYKINGSKSKGVFFGAGAVFGLGVSGKGKSKEKLEDGSSETFSYKIKFDGKSDAIDENAHLKSVEIGANIFVGYQLPNNLRVSLQLRPDFSNLSVSSGSTYRSTYLGLTVGYIL